MAVHQSSWRRLMYAQRQCTRIICAAINLIFTFFLFIQLLSVSLPLGYSLRTLLQRCLVYIFSGLFNTHSNDSRHSYLKFGVRSVICCFSVLAWRVALQFSSAMHFNVIAKWFIMLCHALVFDCAFAGMKEVSIVLINAENAVNDDAPMRWTSSPSPSKTVKKPNNNLYNQKWSIIFVFAIQ